MGLELSEQGFRRLDGLREEAASALAQATAKARAAIEAETRHSAAARDVLTPFRADFVKAKDAFFDQERTAIERRRAAVRRWGAGVKILLAAPVVLWLRGRLASIGGRVAVFRRSLATQLRAARQRHGFLSTNGDCELWRLTREESERLTAIDELLRREETAGAIGELALLDELRRLPDEFAIINDLKLRADSFLRDASGVPLQSAQIDHVVVGPTGVFVVETKNWSKGFAASSRAYNPCEQVERANRLCFVLLKEQGHPPRVQSIVAFVNHVPAGLGRRHVRVLPLRSVRQCILSSQGHLNGLEAESITRFLLGRHDSG